MVLSWIRRIGADILDLLFPPACLGCGISAAGYLCGACRAGIARPLPPLCACCGRSLSEEISAPAGIHPQGAMCHRCQRVPPEFALCRAYGAYAGALRAAILGLKYQGRLAVVPELAELLAQVVAEEPLLQRAQVLVPVPLHPQRVRGRGFNQSELLAKALAEVTGMEMRRDLVVKARHTRPQVGLSAEERRLNLRGAFQLRSVQVLPERVVLVDDVTTTGSTFDECARTLRAAGVHSVYALALAQG